MRRNDDTLILALACGANVEAAARKADVSARTLFRRLKDPVFRKKVDDKRAEILSRSSAMLSAGCSEAVRTLLALQTENASPTVRLGAARAVLELGIKLKETVELDKRLGELEAKIAGQAD